MVVVAGSTGAADFNTAIGYRSLYSNTTGYQNSAMGSNALLSNTTGYYNEPRVNSHNILRDER